MRRAIEAVIDAAHRNGRPIGLCGQAPSDNPAFARFLVDAGIDTISATPESFAVVKANIRDAELPASRPLISAAE